MTTPEINSAPVINPAAAADAVATNVTPSVSLEALNKLKACFEPERWSKIERQAGKQAANLQELCTRMLATSAARYPGNDKAALYSAANRLLISLSSVLKPEDVQRFEAALKPAQAVPAEVPAAADADVPADAGTSTAKPKRRGVSADAAPPAAN